MSEDLTKLDLIGLLDLLEPLPEPQPVPLWPQTAGWFWLGLIFFALAAWLARRWLLRRRANAYRRAALREIAAAGEDPSILAAILRRTALAAFPRAQVAGLYGEAWLAFLDQAYGGTEFSSGPGRVLARAPYDKGSDAAELAVLAADWVRRHCGPGRAGQ